jgi:hypothetical protein
MPISVVIINQNKWLVLHPSLNKSRLRNLVLRLNPQQRGFVENCLSSIVFVEAPPTIFVHRNGGVKMKKTLFGLLLSLAGTVCFSGSVVMAQHWHVDRGERRDLREDRRDIRSDTRDIRSDRRDLRADARERNRDIRELRQDRHEGASQAELRSDRRDINGDTRDIRQDNRDLRLDRRDRRADVHDLYRDRRHARHD